MWLMFLSIITIELGVSHRGYVSILIGCCFAWRILSLALIKTVYFPYLSALHPACIPLSFSMLSIIYLQPEKKCMYHTG